MRWLNTFLALVLIFAIGGWRIAWQHRWQLDQTDIALARAENSQALTGQLRSADERLTAAKDELRRLVISTLAENRLRRMSESAPDIGKAEVAGDAGSRASANPVGPTPRESERLGTWMLSQPLGPAQMLRLSEFDDLRPRELPNQVTLQSSALVIWPQLRRHFPDPHIGVVEARTVISARPNSDWFKQLDPVDRDHVAVVVSHLLKQSSLRDDVDPSSVSASLSFLARVDSEVARQLISTRVSQQGESRSPLTRYQQLMSQEAISPEDVSTWGHRYSDQSDLNMMRLMDLINRLPAVIRGRAISNELRDRRGSDKAWIIGSALTRQMNLLRELPVDALSGYTFNSKETHGDFPGIPISFLDRWQEAEVNQSTSTLAIHRFGCLDAVAQKRQLIRWKSGLVDPEHLSIIKVGPAIVGTGLHSDAVLAKWLTQSEHAERMLALLAIYSATEEADHVRTPLPNLLDYLFEKHAEGADDYVSFLMRQYRWPNQVIKGFSKHSVDAEAAICRFLLTTQDAHMLPGIDAALSFLGQHGGALSDSVLAVTQSKFDERGRQRFEATRLAIRQRTTGFGRRPLTKGRFED